MSRNDLERALDEARADVRRYRAAWRRVEDLNRKLDGEVQQSREYISRLPYPSDVEHAEREVQLLRRALHVIWRSNDSQLAEKALACEFAYIFDHAEIIGIEVPDEGMSR